MVYEIQSITKKRFELANSAPVNTSLLRHAVGLCASTDYVIELLQRKIPIPFDLNDATTLLVEEIQRIYPKLEHLHSPTVITLEIYKHYWGYTTERSSLAWSKIYIGNWTAIRHLDKLIHLTCTQLNLIASTGLHSLRWGNSLQVFLEKVSGVAPVDKLRAILLMEGDFNILNKWFFGHETVNKLYQISYVPEDQ